MWGLKGSIFLHICAFLLLTIKPIILPSKTISQPPAIRVDMVALPDKDPLPAPKPKEENQKTEKKEVKKKVVKKNKPVKKQVKKKPAKKETKKPVEENSFGKSAIEKIKQIQDMKKNMDLTNSPSYAYKGNRIAPGTALSGMERMHYDRYIDDLREHARSYWSIPGWLANSGLNAKVQLFLDENGRLIRQVMIKSSGDSRFDQSVIDSIQDASPFPRPVDKFVDLVKAGGITLSLSP